MAQTIVGLDLGAESIKITRLEASLFRFEFLDFAEHTLPTNVDLPWEQIVTNVLQVLFADRGVRAEKVIASIPGRYVSTRLLHFPFSDRKKIEQALPFEIEGLIPFPLESILLDYQILETSPDGAWVLALFTEKELLETHLALLREASLDPHAVIPAPVALANLWKEVVPEETDSFAIVDLGERETSLCVLQDRCIRYSRSWALGALSLTQALSESLDLPMNQAREKKEGEADLFATPTPGGDSQKEWMANILRKALDPIVGGIRQSLMSLSKTSDLDVRKVYICGKGSHLKGLTDYLTRELQIEVAPLVLNGTVGAILQEKEVDQASCATSLGLAFHGVREIRTTRLNLRTGEYTYVSERAELKRQLISGGIMLTILLVMALALFGLKYHDRSQEYGRINARMESLAVETFPELKRIPQGKQRISAMNQRLDREKREMDLFAPFSPEGLSVLDILREITEAVPKDVTIDVRELIIEGDKVRIESAETDSYNAAEQIKENLLNSGVFTGADMPEVKDSLDQSKVKFKMNLTLNQKVL